MPDRPARDPEPTTHLTRDELLRRVAAGGALAAGGSLLASNLARAGVRPQAATPKRGGQLRVGLIGSGNADNLSPALADNNGIGILRTYLIYDTLVRLTADSRLAPGVASEWHPNKTFTSWTFKLRPGVTFHDG